MNISVAIAVKDEVETYRKKAGDIIAIMPGGHQWSAQEMKNHLILEIALPANITFDMVRRLEAKYLEGGVFDADVPTVAKRRFKIDIDTLKSVIAGLGITVNWDDVANPDIIYCPLSEQIEAPGGTTVPLNPLSLVYDKYNARIVKGNDLSRLNN